VETFTDTQLILFELVSYVHGLLRILSRILKAERWSTKGGHDLQYRLLVSRVNTSGFSETKTTNPRAPKAATLRDVMSAWPSLRSTTVTSHR
jgi:hypothetical protein